MKSLPSALIRIKHLLFSSRRRIITTAIVFVVLLFAAWRVFGQQSKQPQYQTAQVTRTTIISSVSESGNISAGSQVSVASPTDGIITNLYVKNGDEVSAGQDLFEVKATATPQEQASAYATYENAVNAQLTAQQNKLALQASLEKDRQAAIDAQDAVDQMNNNVAVGANNPATKQAYTQNEKDSINSQLTSAHDTFSADEAKYNDANTAIAAAQASLNSASLAYQATQDSVVTAPTDGTVANLTASIGGNVSASGGNATSSTTGTSSNTSSINSSASTSSPILIIGNFSELSVKVAASEVDIPNIKTGQKATITLDAFPGKTYVGTVTAVDTIGTTSSGVVTYNVYVAFAYAPPGVQPGMSASVNIETAKENDVLTVPSSAVQSSNGQSYVRVFKNGQITQTPVTTGITSDTDTEITSGLTEGQTVITGFLTPSSATGTTGASPFSGLGGARGGGFGGGFGGGGARTGGGGAARGQ